MDIRIHEHSLFDHANSRQAMAKVAGSSSSSIGAYQNVGVSIASGAAKIPTEEHQRRLEDDESNMFEEQEGED